MPSGIEYETFDRGRGLNVWAHDRTLQRELRRILPAESFEWAEPRLTEFGSIVGTTVAKNADRIDDAGPELETYDRDGRVHNHVRYPRELTETERLVYESGIVADAFEAPPGRDEPASHAHTLGMLMLLSYADPGVACPVAMTAGAALVLERFDDGTLDAYVRGLTARNHDDLLEGAMFLTERQGGSDVGAIETVAEWDESTGYWRLSGEKWFCSNIDAEGTLALARTTDAPAGTEGLSMFLVPHQDPDVGVLTKGDRADGPLAPDACNDQRYRRLKDKLGTVSVPTGEVEFTGAKAHLVGEQRCGFRQMAEMLNLERLANAAASCGIVGRVLLECKIHAANREAFGAPIERHPLLRADLVHMAITHEAATAFTFDAARLFSIREREARIERGDIERGDLERGDLEHGDLERGDIERGDLERAANGSGNGEGSVDGVYRDPVDQVVRSGQDAYRLMRALIPIAKLRTARMAVETASYGMEIHGGNGYVRDFVTHRLLRDAQVLPIWEGTENVLSLDLLRALDREAAHEPLLTTIDARLEAVSHDGLANAVATTRTEYDGLATAIAGLAGADPDDAQLAAKRLAHYVFDVYTAALLLAEAAADLDGEGPAGEADGRTALVARRFVDRQLRDHDARGITARDRFPMEHFDAVVRYAPVDPETV